MKLIIRRFRLDKRGTSSYNLKLVTISAMMATSLDGFKRGQNKFREDMFVNAILCIIFTVTSSMLLNTSKGGNKKIGEEMVCAHVCFCFRNTHMKLWIWALYCNSSECFPPFSHPSLTSGGSTEYSKGHRHLSAVSVKLRLNPTV